jgi:hypothetical protein
MWGQTYKFRLEKIYLHLLIFIMVNIIDIDETFGAPVPNIGGEPALAEVQIAGIATVTLTEQPEDLPAETVAEQTACESEIPSKSRPTASSRKAGPTAKKVVTKKQPGKVKAISPAKGAVTQLPKHGLTVAEREELQELRALREERNRKEREAAEKVKAPVIRKVEKDDISLSDDMEFEDVCLSSMVRTRQESPSPVRSR